MEVGAYEAKTHLPSLLERVQHGERVTITKHGVPVAMLVPVERRDEEAIRRSIEGLRHMREGLDAAGFRLCDVLREGESLRDLAHDGHRY